MQWCGSSQAHHSIALVAQLGELLLVLRAHALEQRAGRARLVLVDLRDREADVDQDPVAGLDRLVAVEEADVDVPPDSGNIDLGEPVVLVDDLHDASWDGQAHLRVDLLLSVPSEGEGARTARATYLPVGVACNSWRIGTDAVCRRAYAPSGDGIRLTAGPAGGGSGPTAPQTRSGTGAFCVALRPPPSERDARLPARRRERRRAHW